MEEDTLFDARTDEGLLDKIADEHRLMRLQIEHVIKARSEAKARLA